MGDAPIFFSTHPQGLGSLGRIPSVERETAVEALRQVVQHVVESEGMSLVDLQWSRRGRRWVLVLFIEKENGITLDDCALISRLIGGRIEVDNLIDHAYTLEVSSPGLDRPLRSLPDYERFEEHLARITTMTPVRGRSTVIIGRLKGVEGESILVEAEGTGIVPIPFGQIKHARLEVEF